MKIKNLSILAILAIFAIVSISSAAEQSISNWIVQVTNAGEPEHSNDFIEIMNGCAVENTYRNNAKTQSKLTAQQWNDLGLYRNWLTNGGGNELVDKWATNGVLTETEKEYLYIIKSAYMYRGWTPEMGNPRNPPEGATNEHIYLTNVIHIGELAFEKGYEHRVLDDNDITNLRNYAIFFAMRATGVHRLPFEFDLTRHYTDFTGGENSIDFKLPVLESILDLPSCTNNVYGQDRAGFLKQTGVLKMLDFLDGYNTNGAGDVICNPPVEYSGLSNSDYKVLSDYATNQRPVVLIFAYPPDVWMKILPGGLQPIFQAYKNEVDFLFVNINYHDTYASIQPDFYGTLGSLSVCHPRTIEQRAQLGKHIYMKYPNFTVPMVLDDIPSTTRNKYFAQGGDAHFVILDKNGKVDYSSPYRWNAWTDANYTDTLMWFNDMEIEINRMRSNNFEAETGRNFGGMSRRLKDFRFATRPAFTNVVAPKYGGGGPENKYTWLTGRIVKIDGTNVTVSVELPNSSEMKGLNFIEEDEPSLNFDTITTENLASVREWIARENSSTNYLFQTGADVPLFINGDEANPEDFKVGYFVGVWYDLTLDPISSFIKPLALRASNVTTNIPQNPSVIINGGATSTQVRTVSLALSASNPPPVEMQVSESINFANADWTNYSSTFPFTLSEGVGKKTVYARFFSGNYSFSETASNTIEYVPEPGIGIVIGNLLPVIGGLIAMRH